MPAHAMGKGLSRARSISSVHNTYYQTLIKYLILLLIQLMARARTGGWHRFTPCRQRALVPSGSCTRITKGGQNRPRSQF